MSRAVLISQFSAGVAQLIVRLNLAHRMKTRVISLSCWLSAILITILCSVLFARWGLFSTFTVVSIIWAAMDSRRIRLWRYYTGISGGPLTIFVLLLVIGWPLVFPWYLGMRLKIWAGVARLRDEYRPWQMSNHTLGPSGLLQPWRGRKL